MKILLLLFIMFNYCAAAQLPEESCKKINDIAFLEQQAHLRLNSNQALTGASDNFNVNYYRLEIQVDPAVNYITGIVTVYYTILADANNIVLDLSSPLVVDNALQRTNVLGFSQPLNTVQVNFPSTVAAGTLDSISIFYHGVPPNTGFGSFVVSTHSGTPVMWSLSEPYGARDWWPCKNGLTDKADSIDVLVTAPNQYSAASNGLLQYVVPSPTDATKNITYWKHRYPIATYLICFAVTNYATFNNSVQLGAVTLPMQTFCFPESLSSFQSGTQNVLDALQLFNDNFGDYPFNKEKYGHVQFGWGGGMEHQTSTFVVSINESLIAHELAHQWFGDKITCGSWRDIWLNEGFATFLASFYNENKYPSTIIPNRKNEIAYITSVPNGSVWVNDTTNVSRIFDSRLSYNKGSHLLYMLRWILTDPVFFTAIRNYQADPLLKYNFAVTADLKRNLEQTSGKDLTYFFNEWFYNQGYPSYNVTWGNAGNGNVNITMHQTTSDPSVSFFELPVQLVFKNATQTDTIVVNNTTNNQNFTVNIGFVADTVLIDPNYWLITANNTTTKLPDAPLPIKIKSFETVSDHCLAQINFTIAATYNVQNVELQISNDGTHFSKLEYIAIITNTSIEKSYQYNYNMQPNENYFFRLKIYNDDGSIHYSAVSKTNGCKNTNQNISITPNPVVGGAKLTGMPDGKNLIKLFNSNGRLLETFIANNNSYLLDMTSYPEGLYFLKILSATGKINNLSFVKAN